MTTPTQKTALITGASSGIGLEFAKIFADKGWNLVLVSRDPEQLQKVTTALLALFPITIHTIPCDLTQPDAASSILEKTNELNLTIDALINNAGIGHFGTFEETPEEKNAEMIMLNNHALVALTNAYLPQLKSKKRAYILNVASVAGFGPGPSMAVYFATKAFVVSFSQALAYELKKTSITVTTLCPGATETNFAKRADALLTELFQGNTLTAREVAHTGFEAMMKGRVLVIVGFKNKLLIFLSRFLPRTWLTSITTSMMKTRTKMKTKQKTKMSS